MREILFRGKTKSGEWVYGFYGHKPNGNEVEEHFIMEWCFNGASNRVDTYFLDVPVIPETVGQYTGLKDKNGKDIFEGDILQAENISYTGTYGFAVIKFGEYKDCDFVDDSGYCSSGVGFYAFLTSTNGIVGIERYMVATMEIIGNIHDNPELFNDSL